MAKNLMSAYQFAKLKGVTEMVIYRLMAAGKIKTEVVGKHKYMDANKYMHLQFKVPKERKVEG